MSVRESHHQCNTSSHSKDVFDKSVSCFHSHLSLESWCPSFCSLFLFSVRKFPLTRRISSSCSPGIHSAFLDSFHSLSLSLRLFLFPILFHCLFIFRKSLLPPTLFPLVAINMDVVRRTFPCCRVEVNGRRRQDWNSFKWAHNI